MSRREYTPEEIEAIIEENKRFKETKAEREKSSVADVSSQVAMNEKLLEIELKLADVRGDGMEKYKIAGDLIKSMSKSQEEAFKRGGEEARKVAEELGVTIEQLQNMHDLYNDLGKVGREAYDDMRKGAEGLAQKMFLVDDNADRILGSIIKIGEMAKSPEGLKGMAMAIKDTFKPIRILSSLMLKIFEATLDAIIATDKATAAFAKNSGMGRVATASISKFGTAHANLGVTVADSGKYHEALTEQVAGFLNVQGKAREQMLLTTAMFDKLGVGADVAGQMIEDFSKRLNITGGEAANMTRDLALTAKGLGMSMKKFVTAFNSANKSLAVYGREGVKVFKNVAAAARAAGVETETLLGLAGKFDTFSDAADTTGKLNAILGTQMSAMDLLNKKEEERIEYLMRNMQATGKSFSQMDRFTQKAIAQAAGISDMAQANKIFGMSFKDYKKNQRDMAAQEKSQEEANKRMKDAMDIMQALKAIMQEFVIKGIGPHVDKIKDAVVVLGDFIHKIMSGKAPLITFGAGLLGIAVILSPLLGLFRFFGWNLSFIGKGLVKVIGFLATKTAALFGYTVGQEAANNAQKKSNRISAAGTMKMKKLSMAVMMMGIGVGIAAAGVALLVSQLGQLSGAKMFQVTLAIIVLGAAFAGFVFLMMKMAPATAIAATSLMYLGGAFLLISIGVAIIAAGMSVLVQTIAQLGQSGASAVNILFSLASATMSLAGATAMLGNPLSLLGMMSLLSTMNKLITLSNSMQGISQGVAASVKGLGTLAVDIKESIEKFALLANADFLKVFSGLYFGIRAFLSALDLNSQYGVKVTHTLENLALIATGKSAGSINGNTGNAIVSAINRMAAAKANQQTIKVTVDAEHIKQALRDGYFEIRSE